MKRNHLTLKITVFLLIAASSFAQIKIIQLLPTGLTKENLAVEGTSNFRQIISLNDNWYVYKQEEPEKRTKVKIPLTFQNSDKLVFEKDFLLTDNLFDKNLRLIIYGLNYSGEFLLNDITVYHSAGGAVPVNFILPPEALNKGQNVLKIIVNGNLDNKITLPVAQRFLFPKYHAGILGDVLLETLPNSSVANLKIRTEQNTPRKTAEIFCNLDLVSQNSKDTSLNKEIVVRAKVYDESSAVLINKSFKYPTNRENLSFKLKLKGVKYWSPASPNFYHLTVSIIENGETVDKLQKEFSIFDLSQNREGMFLNGHPFSFVGTIYSEPDIDILKDTFFNSVKKDLELIKKSGFNTVRFKFTYPYPFELKLCREIGLLPIVEIPLNNPPTEFTTDKSYVKRITDILKTAANYYSKFENVIIFGLGSSYLNCNTKTRAFISKLAKTVSGKDLLTFASFKDFPSVGVPGLRLYGKEIYAKPYTSFFDSLKNSPISEKTFISEISYPKVYGHTNGYLNQYSIEAQAHYFSGLIDRIKRQRTNGFVINSIFDYRGDFTSFYAGYSKDNVYRIGLTNESRNVNSLGLRIVSSKLFNRKGGKILLGTRKSRSPVFFILMGLILGIIMGLLFNSKRQFREDATRSLIRPYNFFADIRDHRILSGFHAFILMLVLAGAHSLLITIILYFLRMNILLEKILIAFNSFCLTNVLSYLAWHPIASFFILWGFSILLFPIMAGILKIGSLFVKQKVFFSNIYFVTVWSFLPLTILLPLELVLHKILLANVINIYIYALLLLFLLWTIKRLFMGTYIIFDVTPRAVYFWGILFILIFLAIKIVYFQATQDTLYYILAALKEYPLI